MLGPWRLFSPSFGHTIYPDPFLHVHVHTQSVVSCLQIFDFHLSAWKNISYVIETYSTFSDVGLNNTCYCYCFQCHVMQGFMMFYGLFHLVPNCILIWYAWLCNHLLSPWGRSSTCRKSACQRHDRCLTFAKGAGLADFFQQDNEVQSRSTGIFTGFMTVSFGWIWRFCS